MKPEDLVTGGTVVGIITAVSGILKMFFDFRARKKDIDDLKAEVEKLKADKQELEQKKKELEEELARNKNINDDECKKLEDKIRELKQQISTVQIAFGVAYHSIVQKLGPNDPLLATLKGYINNGTGNLTS